MMDHFKRISDTSPCAFERVPFHVGYVNSEQHSEKLYFINTTGIFIYIHI